jgi:uncharacterized protein YndB with AHSA1/START domain
MMIPTLPTIELDFARNIPAKPTEVYDAWLDPEIPGSPWEGGDKLIFNPMVDGLFYRLQVKWGIELPHYGCFTTLDRPRKICNTWMSRHTRGLETIVTVSFAPRESGTLQELNHANIPDDELGLRHKPGWEHYLGVLANCFGSGR